MNNQTNEKSSGAKRWLPMLLIAVFAIAAGIFAGNLKLGGDEVSTDATGAEDAAFVALQSQLLNSTLLPDGFKQVPAFSLTQGDASPLTEANLKGKWSVLFFGFINCPDVCPITLSEMNTVVSMLEKENAEIPQVFFITVDPARDTAEKIKDYVAYFNSSFIGGTGDLADITALTRKLGVVASYTASTANDGSYTVDHTASMLLVDPELQVRAKLNAPHKADTIAADIKVLLSQP